MALQARLEDDLKSAMREGARIKKSTLRLALTEIKLDSVSRGRPLSDDEIVAVMRKQLQIRREEISAANQAGRPDLIEEAENEISVLEKYLPAPFPPEELERLASEAIAETNANSISDSGQVMKILMPRLLGRVPGGEAHKMVQDLLTRDG